MIIMITGGQRSGKSLFAERLALSLSANPRYIATAQIFDEDFRHRVDVHKQRRGRQWTTFEEPLHVDSISLTSDDVVVFDCVTLWATNWFFECGEDGTRALDEMKKAFDRTWSRREPHSSWLQMKSASAEFSENAMQRRFTDLQGSINQHVASIADEVHFIVSGIDLKIK